MLSCFFSEGQWTMDFIKFIWYKKFYLLCSVQTNSEKVFTMDVDYEGQVKVEVLSLFIKL